MQNAAAAAAQQNNVEQPPTSPSDEAEDEEEQFFDAETGTDVDFGAKLLEPLDLVAALQDANVAISLFFNNKFLEARQQLQPYVHCSMYHAMGSAVFAFLEAVLTFEQQSMVSAAEQIKKCLLLCQKERKKLTLGQSIGSKFRKCNFNDFSDVEAHAELCFAETLLLRALLTFLEDETLASLIKGAMKIRQCFNCYKDCAEILKQREWKSTVARTHFESGVCMGLGTFNLMISLLPARIIKILEFIGFSGNKSLGLSNLNHGYSVQGLRQVLCALCLLAYHLIVCYVLSHQEGDLQFCEQILQEQMRVYPNGVWFLYFKGRLEFMKGNFDDAIVWYNKSCDSQTQWQQFKHLSYWELLWVHSLQQNWTQANVFATHLLQENKWSRTMYCYQKAAIMLMMKTATTQKQAIDELMRDAPLHKQRIAGKSLPMEKFICYKVQRYFAQNNQLCLPMFELMQLWNFFKVLRRNTDAIREIHVVIEREMQQLQDDDEFKWDNRALCLLLRGICYRHMQKTYLALQDLNECTQLETQLKADTYLIPYAFVEIALLHAEERRTQLAVTILETTRKKYTGYLLESRLHFRIHAALQELKEH